MPAHYEHPSKASRWANGRLFVHPDAEQEDATVWVQFDDDADSEPLWEGLLARRLGPDRVRLCAVRAYAYDLDLGDELEVVEDEGALIATHVAAASGNFTFRVLFPQAARASMDERLLELMRELEQFHCWFGVMSPRFLAISAAYEQSQHVASYLWGREQRGELNFETGRQSSSRLTTTMDDVEAT